MRLSIIIVTPFTCKNRKIFGLFRHKVKKMPRNFAKTYKKLTFAIRNLKDRIITKRIYKMAEQKKTNEALNVEEALTQSEAFLIKYKKQLSVP